MADLGYFLFGKLLKLDTIDIDRVFDKLIFGEQIFVQFASCLLKDFIEVGLDPEFIGFADDPVIIIGVDIWNAFFDRVGLGGQIAIVVNLKHSLKCPLLRV